MKMRKMIPDIPTGLADQIIKRRFGKSDAKIGDIILSKIAAEAMLEEIEANLGKSSSIYKSVSKQILKFEKELFVRVDCLKSWYSSYFALAVQCNECAFNEKGQYCSFYGKGKIPLIDPTNLNSKCEHKIKKGKSGTREIKRPDHN